MNVYQDIEAALKRISPSKFQELCDAYLKETIRDYSAFSRSGSQLGKDKTVVSAVDSFFLLSDGQYILVEHSTNISQGFRKLKESIEKCLDEERLGIPIKKISEIILCYNFRLTIPETEDLYSIGMENKVRVKLLGVDDLAMDLARHYRGLAADYLSIPLDTGQIVSIDQFIDEYNHASNSIATPLDNIFLHREKEVNELLSNLNSSDYVILSGTAGVGKTKLGLEAIQKFIQTNINYRIFCIANRYAPGLYADLQYYFNDDENYILFIDDANRNPFLKSIIGYSQIPRRKGKLKLVLTVRSYALNEVERELSGCKYEKVEVGKLTDDEITDILKSDSFNIQNYEYQKAIRDVAEGNPRIALMAAKLAIDRQSLRVFYDVSALFEKYYSTFVTDKNELEDQDKIKTLGIIAFFYALPLKKAKILEPILTDFDLDRGKFLSNVIVLERAELIEVQFDTAKITEQNIGSFFFYKAFFKDQLLSFTTLLKKHFYQNPSLFTDALIPIANNFGYLNIQPIISPQLISYLSQIVHDHSKCMTFLNRFWFFIQDRTISYLFEYIKGLPESIPPSNYVVTYDLNQFSHHRNQVIQLLGNFLRNPDTVWEALELLFLYVQKVPGHSAELVYELNYRFSLNSEDLKMNYKRQGLFMDFIIKRIEDEDVLGTNVFYEVGLTLLQYSFTQHTSERFHQITVQTIKTPAIDSIFTLRSQIWSVIDDHFEKYFKQSVNILRKYSQRHPDEVPKIIIQDIPKVIKLIHKYLVTSNFEHCVIVHKLIRLFHASGSRKKELQNLKKSYSNKTYRTFLALRYDFHSEKEHYNTSDWKTYEKLKKADIEKSFLFSNNQEINGFFSALDVILKSESDWNFSMAVLIVTQSNFENNFSRGLSVLSRITQHDTGYNFLPGRILSDHVNNIQEARSIWSIIEKVQVDIRIGWVLAFFIYVDVSYFELDINDKHSCFNLNTLLFEIEKTPTLNRTLLLNDFERFLNIDPLFFNKLLKIIYNKNLESGDARFYIWDDFFETCGQFFHDDFDLFEKSYLQQNNIQQHFDFNGDSLKAILNQNPYFLITYVKDLIENNKRLLRGDGKNLNFVWELQNADELILEVFHTIRESPKVFSLGKHFCTRFFANLSGENSEKAKAFINKYIQLFNNNRKAMDDIAGIVRSVMPDYRENLLHQYLSYNSNKDDFMNISWRGRGGEVLSGNVSWGEIEAAEWEEILAMIEKLEMGVKLIPIKSHLKQVIQRSLSYADTERERKFLERYY